MTVNYHLNQCRYIIFYIIYININNFFILYKKMLWKLKTINNITLFRMHWTHLILIQYFQHNLFTQVVKNISGTLQPTIVRPLILINWNQLVINPWICIYVYASWKRCWDHLKDDKYFYLCSLLMKCYLILFNK